MSEKSELLASLGGWSMLVFAYSSPSSWMANVLVSITLLVFIPKMPYVAGLYMPVSRKAVYWEDLLISL